MMESPARLGRTPWTRESLAKYFLFSFYFIFIFTRGSARQQANPASSIKKSRIVGNDPSTASFNGIVGLDFGIVCVVAAFWLPADPSKRSRKASEFFFCFFFFPQNREAKKKKFMSAFFCVAERVVLDAVLNVCRCRFDRSLFTARRKIASGWSSASFIWGSKPWKGQ
jgi:hypothetical protein